MIGRIALFTIGSIAAAGTEMGASAQQFSADMNRPATGTIYVADGKIRLETNDPDGGLTVTIADGKARTTYMLLPTEKTYVDVTQQTYLVQTLIISDPNNACAQWQELVWQKVMDDAEHWVCRRVGEEALGGRNAVKYEIVRPNGERSYDWVDIKLKAVIKSEGAAFDEGVELRNIKEGSQPAKLFEIPGDYRMMDINEWLQRNLPPDWGDDQ